MIDQRLIKVHQEFQTQEEVFQALSQLIVRTGYATDEAAVLKGLHTRESEGTTGMMDGYAIPHAKSSAIQRPAIAVFKLTQGIDWNSMDGKPTQFIVALFIPEKESGTTHLQLLSQLARLLMRREFKNAFEQAQTEKELEQLLQSELL